jgi:endonuclease/exonuclease/phosphatase family metal-dependent hydrolase
VRDADSVATSALLQLHMRSAAFSFGSRVLCVSRALVAVLLVVCAPHARADEVVLRVATFNIEDVRTSDIANPQQPRLKRLAEIIQRVRPNVILLNEIAYDQPGAPGFVEGSAPGKNAELFVKNFLSVPQAAGLEAMSFSAFMAPVNTGMNSGFDLDRNGKVVTTFPSPDPADAEGFPPRQTDAQREFGGDCWGFGTFPGQYGMALLVDERLTIRAGDVRTFRLLPWDYMPGAFIPLEQDQRTAWWPSDVLAVFRLSSKSHWDVPIELPGGAVVHFLCSHPTPPAFDGEEKRNARRNHDEIRFWVDYLENASYIVDDNNTPGGLKPRSSFVILGDLNADPDKGSSFKDPIDNLLGADDRINVNEVPASTIVIPGLEADETARFKLRVDYVLPSRDMKVLRTGVWRDMPTGTPGSKFPSDHFPVWVDVSVPASK